MPQRYDERNIEQSDGCSATEDSRRCLARLDRVRGKGYNLK
jgi:hypothetical protein